MVSYVWGDREPAAGRELGGALLTCDFCDTALGVDGGMHDRRVPRATLCRGERCMVERAGLTDEEIGNVIAAHRGE